jgi:hypothetical protein
MVTMTVILHCLVRLYGIPVIGGPIQICLAFVIEKDRESTGATGVSPFQYAGKSEKTREERHGE